MRVAHSGHASNNPKAYYKKRVTVEEVINSRIICKPLHLLDAAWRRQRHRLVITSADRARDGAPAGADPRIAGACASRAPTCTQHGPISRVAGYYGREILWPNAGVAPEDVDSPALRRLPFTTMLQLEDTALQEGRRRALRQRRTIKLGGRRPNNTSGRPSVRGLHPRHNMVIENVRQLRRCR